MLNLIISPPDSNLLYAGNYDPILVILSVIIAIFASYAALLVSHSIEASNTTLSRRLWIIGGSLCFGTGIWAMHFIGMLAFNLPCSTSYDPTLTFISTLPGILASALALKTISRPTLSRAQLALGGVLIGSGIGTMHYAGMAAMHLDGFIRYDLKLFLLSIVVAVVLALLALQVKFHMQSHESSWKRWGLLASATVMGLAVSGMHYTAMAAAYFIRDEGRLIDPGIAPPFLAAIVLAVSSLIVVLTIVATYIGKPQKISTGRPYRLIALLILAWAAASWLSADYYYSRQTSDIYLRESQLAAQKAQELAENIDSNTHLLKGIALMFSSDSETKQSLRSFGINTTPSTLQLAEKKQRWLQNSTFAELNEELEVAASNLGADVIFIMNAAGDCIASSNAKKPESFVGTNYKDRAYFRQAMNGEPGHQYAVGRTSNVPGLYYSHPVIDAGKILGAVVVKRNITHFSRWVNQASGFITDANGVIVLTYDTNLAFHHLPDADFVRLSAEKKLLQYKQNSITPLDVTPWQTERFPAALLIGNVPVVVAHKNLPEDAITLYAIHSLQEITRQDNEKIWLFLMLTATGSMLIVGASAVALYLRDSKRTAADLRIAASAFEAQAGMLITDENCAILRVNSAFTSITGYSMEDVIGRTPKILRSGSHNADYYAAMWADISLTGSWDGEIWNRRKNGEIFPEYLTITAVKDHTGAVTNYVGTFNDISSNKIAEDAINKLAFYDPLTNLPNRRLLMDRLQHALTSSARNARTGALLFIDLDDFKAINDTLGHNIGDLLLQQVAQRLISCVREVDTVARMGGDEFVVMLEDLSELAIDAASQTEHIGEKILAALNQPYRLETHELHNTPSIGATLFSDHPQTIEELMKQSDIAMYQSKKEGRNTLRFFDPQMQHTITARVILEAELRKAIEEQQFQLYYQIQVDASRRAVGAESLLRWIHPERGLISPAQFIPLLEETDLILPAGLWVLETACAQLKAWQQNALTQHLTLSVNVSAKQFCQTDFVNQVRAIVAHHGIRPELLELELTESMLQENIKDTIDTMNALHDIGIQFSLDDFGTGYSSLQYLKRLPLDQLKIDQSFVRDLTTDNSDKAIVRTIIAMASGLNLGIIAEGVETEAQLDILRTKGCTHFQGYLFSKPVPIEQFEALLIPR